MDEEEFAECIRSATDSLKRIADALSKEEEVYRVNHDAVVQYYFRRFEEQNGRCEDDD